MAHISYNKILESEFDGIVSKGDKLQDLNINQLKLEVHDTYKKDERTWEIFIFDVALFLNYIYEKNHWMTSFTFL